MEQVIGGFGVMNIEKSRWSKSLNAGCHSFNSALIPLVFKPYLSAH